MEALAEVRSRAFNGNAEKVSQYVAQAAGSKESFFDAIVDERAWELAGEAVRKYDLIRWGLLIDKTVEMLDSYKHAIEMMSMWQTCIIRKVQVPTLGIW